MNIVLGINLLLIGTISLRSDRADPEVAPSPRVVRADGTRDPVPEATQPKAVNPLETVERIINNSKAVGDKLAMTDTGTETRKTQNEILKDIQSLIDQQENPPPPKPNSNPDMNPDQKDKNPDDMDKKNDMMPKNGMSDMPHDKKNMMPPPEGKSDMPPDKKEMPPGGGGGMGMDQPPMGGSEQPRGRRPRQQNGEQSQERKEQKEQKEQGSKPMEPEKGPGGKGMNQQTGAAGQNPKQGAGQMPDPNNKNDRSPSKPSIPLEETAVKEVWGYLPDKLRQQAMQYYKQEFMPRYSKLLEHYYSSLADKNLKK